MVQELSETPGIPDPPPDRGADSASAGSDCDPANSGVDPADLPLILSQPLIARIIFLLIGCLLAFTAIAKLWLLLTDQFADLRSGFPLAVLWLAVTIEAGMLAALMGSFFSRAEKAILLAGLFLIFSLVSLYRHWMGFASCGCAGAIQIAPWVAACLNGAVAGFLVFVSGGARCSVQTLCTLFTRIRSWYGTSAFHGMWALLSSAIVFLVFWFATPAGARLEALVVGPRVQAANVLMGSCQGSEQRATLVLKNNFNQAVRIIGQNSSCGCTTARAANHVIGPLSTVEVPLTVTRTRLGRFRHRLVFYLDSPRQLYVSADVSGFWQEK